MMKQRFKDAMLLALKLQEGVVSQEMQGMQFRDQNNQGTGFSPESFLKEHSYAGTLVLVRWNWFQSSELWNKKITVCCLKLLSL